MITARNFQKAQNAMISAQEQASEMPNGSFVFIGADNDYIYFNIVAKPTEIAESEKENIEVKTRFTLIQKRDNKFSYCAEFKMAL